MKATSTIIGTENPYKEKPTIVGVRFVGDDGYFGKKTYRYFAARTWPIEVGKWIKVKVGDKVRSVYVVSIEDGAFSETPLKIFWGHHYDSENDKLNTQHARAIAQLKIDSLSKCEQDLAKQDKINSDILNSMAFGAQMDAIDARCKRIVDYKYQTYVLDEARLKSNFPTSNEVAELLQAQPKENIMHPFKLITKTFVTSDEVGQDVDVSKLSDDQIFDLIAKAETEITKLEAVKTKPKKLQQRIDDLQAGITQITAYLDAKA